MGWSGKDGAVVELKNWVADGSGGDGGRSVVFGTNVGAILTKYHASQRLDLPCGARPGTFFFFGLVPFGVGLVSFGVELAVEVQRHAPCFVV